MLLSHRPVGSTHTVSARHEMIGGKLKQGDDNFPPLFGSITLCRLSHIPKNRDETSISAMNIHLVSVTLLLLPTRNAIGQWSGTVSLQFPSWSDCRTKRAGPSHSITGTIAKMSLALTSHPKDILCHSHWTDRLLLSPVHCQTCLSRRRGCDIVNSALESTVAKNSPA